MRFVPKSGDIGYEQGHRPKSGDIGYQDNAAIDGAIGDIDLPKFSFPPSVSADSMGPFPRRKSALGNILFSDLQTNGLWPCTNRCSYLVMRHREAELSKFLKGPTAGCPRSRDVSTVSPLQRYLRRGDTHGQPNRLKVAKLHRRRFCRSEQTLRFVVDQPRDRAENVLQPFQGADVAFSGSRY